jgi:uncharacterized protein involved in exopolysaccharide biosynthesis
MEKEMNEHREPYYTEDEIDLYELIQVLLKRKKLIIGVFLIAVIVAIAASYMMKPVYRVSAVIEPGKIYEPEPARDTLIWREKDTDTPQNIERLIAQNPFHHAILAQLGWDYEDPKNRIDIKTSVQQGTKYISLTIDSSNPEMAREYLSALIDKINVFYLPKVEASATFLNYEKKRIVNEKRCIADQIGLIMHKMQVLEQQNAKLQEHIEVNRRNNEQILDDRKAVQQDLTSVDKLILTLMMENNDIQCQELKQEIETLKSKLTNLDFQAIDVEIKLANLGVKTESLYVQSSELEAQQDDFKSQEIEVSSIKIVKEPAANPQRISPNRKLIVAVAGVLGLFVGVFAAFAVEFWQSHKVSA